jgi:AAA domain
MSDPISEQVWAEHERFLREHRGGRAPGSLGLHRLAEVEPRNVRFLVPGLIPLKTLTLVPGIGGLGKSTWLLARAAELSRGDLGDPGVTLIVSYEDTAEEVLRPRLEAAGAELELVHQVVLANDDFGSVQLPQHVEELVSLAGEAQAKLIIIDPIIAAIDVALDAHKDQHVRFVLARLAQLAEELDCAVALVAHLNKTPSLEEHIRVGGSTAFWNACRSVVFVGGNPDEDERLIMQRKANYARLRPPERHRIEEIVLPETVDAVTGEPIVTSRMVFVEFATDVEASAVLSAHAGGQGEDKTQAAAWFLIRELRDGDWHESRVVKARGEAEGHTERTLQRARVELEIEDKRTGFPAVSYWRLPAVVPTESPQGGTTVEGAWLSQNSGADSQSRQSCHEKGSGPPSLFEELVTEGVSEREARAIAIAMDDDAGAERRQEGER